MSSNPAHSKALREGMAEDRRKRPWALITGSTRGLGLHLALRMVAHELQRYNVILHGRAESDLAQAADKLHERGALVEAVAGDLLNLDTIDRLIEMADQKGISVLVNNAAVYLNGSTGVNHSRQIIETIGVNLIAPMLLSRGCLETLRRKHGIVVNINSMAAHSPGKGEAVYAASKAGLEGFSKAWKLETLPVRVMDVFIGAMNTRMALGRPNPELLIKPEAAAEAIASAIRASRYESSVRVDSLDLRRSWY